MIYCSSFLILKEIDQFQGFLINMAQFKGNRPTGYADIMAAFSEASLYLKNGLLKIHVQFISIMRISVSVL